MKYIYLDENHWINLTHAAENKPGYVKYGPVLHAAKQAVASKSAVFPISIFHIYETLKCGDLKQRKRLARLMTELSANTTIADLTTITSRELIEAVAHEFNLSVKPSNYNPFKMGITYTTHNEMAKKRLIAGSAAQQGISKLRASIQLAQRNSAEGMFEQLSGDNERSRREIIRDGDTDAATIAAAFERFRRGDEGYEQQFLDVHREVLDFALRRCGSTYEALQDRGPKYHRAFLSKVPTIDIQMELMEQRDADLNKPVDPNDLADILAQAAPIKYCDIVVTEKTWRAKAERRLAGQYNTVILSSLTALLPYISTSSDGAST